MHQTHYTRVQSARHAPSRNTSGSQPVVSKWKSYEPHTPAWVRQATSRYPKHLEKLGEIATLATSNPYICYECYETRHLADYYVRGDRTQTFRYCVNCAYNVKVNGARIDKLQDIEEPEIEQAPVSKETRDFSIAEESQGKKGYHPLFYIGITFLACVLLYVLISGGLSLMQSELNRIIYQSPPISQIDVSVNGKNYHAVAQNLNGNIIVIIEPYSDITHLHEYPVAKTSSVSSVPTMNYDGMNTIYVHVGDSIYMVNLSKV